MAKTFKKISFKEAGTKGVSLVYANYDEEGPKDLTRKEIKKQPHKDFTEALQKLCFHFLFLTETLDENKYGTYPDILPEKYRITGVSFSGEDEKEGVIISGYKTLSSGKGFAFNTPLIRLASEEYTFIDQLKVHLTTLQKEAQEYLSGKYLAIQGDLFENNEAGKGDDVIAAAQ